MKKDKESLSTKKTGSKKIFYIVTVLIIISLVVGISFAAFFYFFSSSVNRMDVSSVQLDFFESSDNVISVASAFPIPDSNGKELDEVFEFQVKTTTKRDTAINYVVYMEKLEVQDGYTMFGDDQIKVYLTDYDDNEILKPTLVSDLNNYVLDTRINIHDSDNEEVKVKYKLRTWIDYQTEASSWDENTKLEYKFKLGVRTVENLDTSNANIPQTSSSLIPVYYDESESVWKKADILNEDVDYQWYNYDEKMWANAVLVSNSNRETYKEADLGTEIAKSDILAYYVWIPRYKYKVWNIDKEIGFSHYDAENSGIEIKFENNLSSTGTISCNYDFEKVATSTVKNESCEGNNGEYYTHPAFTFGGKELDGFWMGKFEVTGSSGNVTILPGLQSFKQLSASSYQKEARNMQKENNDYGLSTDSTIEDSHMLRNMEWGAVAYLTNSKYAKCGSDGCSEVGFNSYYGLKTGCGPQSIGNNAIGGNTCYEYNTEKGVAASTTGNIYGVYDMNGGAYEYVMGNSSSVDGSYQYNMGEANSADYEYNDNTLKYMTTYAKGESKSDQTAYNRGRLGDCTGEVVTSSGYSWYGDWGYMPYTSRPWFLRGDYVDDTTGAGVFAFDFFLGAGGWSGVSARFSYIVY